MVKPEEEKPIISRTLEDRLADKFDALQAAREERNHVLFDEIARSIEILLKAIPDAYNQLMVEKAELDKDLVEQLAYIEQQATAAPNQIYRDAILNNESFVAQWDYRETYEEIVIELLQRAKLVPIRQQVYGEIQPIEESPAEIPEQPEQQEQPKPKLSLRRQQSQQEKFEV